MKEYGGYIELEKNHGSMLHEDAEALNCGRNALEYLCEAKKIKKLHLPYFLCSSVPNLCKKVGIEYSYYHIDENFKPLFQQELGDGEWLYIVNYYGQLNNDYLRDLKQKFDWVIVDNAQSYFQLPVDGVDTLYTCRKYFGVADGAFLYTDALLDREIPRDESFERMHFLLGRYERSANEFYTEYAANNKLFATEPIKKMSRLTENLLRGIDYEKVAQRRQDNFDYLNAALEDVNELNLESAYGAFMYPLLIKDGAAIRKALQKEKIYIPTLWPNVLEECDPDSLEYRFAADILPIPVDQRYEIEDMQCIVSNLNKYITHGHDVLRENQQCDMMGNRKNI